MAYREDAIYLHTTKLSKIAPAAGNPAPAPRWRPLFSTVLSLTEKGDVSAVFYGGNTDSLRHRRRVFVLKFASPQPSGERAKLPQLALVRQCHFESEFENQSSPPASPATPEGLRLLSVGRGIIGGVKLSARASSIFSSYSGNPFATNDLESYVDTGADGRNDIFDHPRPTIEADFPPKLGFENHALKTRCWRLV